MRTDTAQRVLWFAMVFIVINIIFTILMALGAIVLTLYFPIIDLAPIITDPEVLAFIQSFPLLIPFAIGILAGLQIIYLGIIYYWRTDPLGHRTGLTIVGILNLLTGWSLSGLLILLPGLLTEDSQ